MANDQKADSDQNRAGGRKAGSRLNPVIHPLLVGLVVMLLFLTWLLVLR
ncbi:MAG: hypothetical protein ACOY5Y_10940 [Pseudomonadota bacterium]